MKFVFFLLLLLGANPGLSQSSTVTDFKENHGTALSLYFYPSTLRMLNLDRNKEFDDMIREIKKARFFKMDSGAVNNEDLSKLESELRKEGFEEVMFMKSKDMDVKVWGIEKRNPSMVILSKSGVDVILMEINGMINITKIPKLAETFNQNSFLDVLNLNAKKN